MSDISAQDAPLTDEVTDSHDPRLAYPELTPGRAYAAWPCVICSTRRDEHASDPTPSRFPELDIPAEDHLYIPASDDATAIITINRPTAVALMKRAVEEKGADYVYQALDVEEGPSCTYSRDGAPDCLVGHALHYAGVTVEELERLDRASRVGIPAPIIPKEITRLSFTQGAKLAFKRAQEQQDRGLSWGNSLDFAESESEGLE